MLGDALDFEALDQLVEILGHVLARPRQLRQRPQFDQRLGDVRRLLIGADDRARVAQHVQRSVCDTLGNCVAKRATCASASATSAGVSPETAMRVVSCCRDAIARTAASPARAARIGPPAPAAAAAMLDPRPPPVPREASAALRPTLPTAPIARPAAPT